MDNTASRTTPRQGIFIRILLITIAMVVASNVLTLGTTYLALDYELQAKDNQLLENESQTLSYYLERVITTLGTDLRQAAGFPALSAFMDHELTPAKEQNPNPWRDHLYDLFAGIIEVNPRYVQIRVIDQDGQEVIRVDQSGSGGQLRWVQGEDLQYKGERDYFLATSVLNAGDTYYSPIELNREHGRIAEPRELVLRAAVPLFSSVSGDRYGILVINMALNKALDVLPSLAGGNRKLMVVNAAGQFLYHPDSQKTLIAANGDHHNFYREYPDLQGLLTPETPRLTHTDHYTLAVTPVRYRSEDTLYLLIRSDDTDAVAVRHLVIKQTLAILSVLLVLAIATATVSSRRLSLPLSLMSKYVAKGKTGHGRLQAALPRHASEEYFRLAEALDTASDLSDEQQQRLEREIAARTRAQQKLEEKMALVDSKNRELNQFTYIASHDLQEPLRTVRSFVGVIETKYANRFDERGVQMLGFIDEACNRMQDLVRDLLDYGRIGRDLSPHQVDLNTLLSAVAEDLGSTIEKRQARIEYENLPEVTGLETELRLLFQNLLSNAIKFTAPDVEPAITVTAKQVDTGWQFAICDNGIGIPEEYRDKVFGVFKRLHGRDAYPGTGIGLAHCQKVVALHGGEIWVEGNPSGGTCMVFTLKEVIDGKGQLDSADR